MGGLGVFLWLGIGAAAGWIISRVMVSASDVSNDLNTSVAALAGSLWLPWITCVVTSGRERRSRRRTPDARVAHGDATADTGNARSTLTYAAARNELVDRLLRDAMAHDAGRYDEIGRRFDGIERLLPHGGAPELGRLRVAVTFWDGWIDARNRGWQPTTGIAKKEWPLLARIVAADLEGDRDVTDIRVATRFDVARHPSLGSRAQVLAARMRV